MRRPRYRSVEDNDMKTNQQELSVLAIVLSLLFLFVIVNPKHDERTSDNRPDNTTFESNMELLRKQNPSHVKILPSNNHDIRNRKNSITRRIPANNRVDSSESHDSAGTSAPGNESNDERMDLSNGLDIHQEELDDVVVAMFQHSENHEVQEEVLDIEEESVRSQTALEEQIFDDLLESGLSIEETEMVLETLFRDIEDDSVEDVFPLEEEALVVTEDTPEEEIATPMEAMDIPEEVVDNLIEAISTANDGYEAEDGSFEGDNQFAALSEEEIEAIVNDFHNLGMTMEEIDGILESISADNYSHDDITE